MLNSSLIGTFYIYAALCTYKKLQSAHLLSSEKSETMHTTDHSPEHKHNLELTYEKKDAALLAYSHKLYIHNTAEPLLLTNTKRTHGHTTDREKLKKLKTLI